MLDDEETYKPLKTKPTASTTKDVNKFINNLLESNKITKEASFRLEISDATTPRLYGLPKLHKENIPLRPIVSFTFTDSPTYGLGIIFTIETTYWKIKTSRKKLFGLCIINYS